MLEKKHTNMNKKIEGLVKRTYSCDMVYLDPPPRLYGDLDYGELHDVISLNLYSDRLKCLDFLKTNHGPYCSTFGILMGNESADSPITGCDQIL